MRPFSSVQIRHPDSNKVLDTYVMLDNCSQGTFVKEETIEVLGITGAETSENTLWRYFTDHHRV